MIDLLVPLYHNPHLEKNTAQQQALKAEGIYVRTVRAYEATSVENWVRDNFSEKWAAEARVACSGNQINCLIATYREKIAGFACFDTTARGFFGPTGVSTTLRGKGVGKALLWQALLALKAKGFAYAIIGGVGPVEFYQKHCQAIIIPDSTPSIYDNLLPDYP